MNAEASSILLVDDDELNSEGLARRLRRHGYEVTVARSGRAAIELLGDHRFDVTLLDIMMPGMSGLEVLKFLRRVDSLIDLPIIMVTARGESKEIVEALELGANDYVTKPLDFPVVLARIQTQLALRRAVSPKEAAEHAYDRLRREMEAAAQLQRALLPATLPAVSGIRFAWEYHPCAGLAGDGLNVFLLDEDHIGLYLLDVSGHGVPAALLSVTLAHLLSPTLSQSSLLRVRQHDQQGYHIVAPADVARQLNEWFLAHPSGEQYFTIIYGVLEVRSRCLRFISAGHPDLLRVHAGAEPVLLRVPGLPIGCLEGTDYEESVLQLRPGDRLFLYSDGVTDALSPAGEHFGGERLRRAVGAVEGEPIQAGTQRVLREVFQWAGDEPQDDLSMLALEIDG
jgi:sigma-B regulation protein RsbU (phosphoserine phosphatase)